MTQPNELRIGNRVQQGVIIAIPSMENSIWDVVFEERNCALFEDVKPILLTRDILLKCGFSDVSEHYRMSYQETYEHPAGNRISLFGDSYVFWTSDMYANFIELKSLHHLQNVFYFLTGEELTFTQ